MSWTIIVVLIVIGVLFLVLELLVFPGTSIAGIIGVGLIVGSVWMAYNQYGKTSGHITLAATIAFVLLIVIISLKARTWNRISLKENITGKALDSVADFVKPGDEGITTSRLSPMGSALINNELYEVKSDEGYLDNGEEVIVKNIESNMIIVKLKNNQK